GALSLKELRHVELRVMPCGDPRIAEVAVALINAIQASHHQPLQIELWRDAQVEIEVESVVVRDERPRRGATGNRLHHRRLYFDEASGFEEVAQFADALSASLQDLPHSSVADQIAV